MRGEGTQHKPTRETRRTREVADLKRLAHKLERENARLRKQLGRAVNSAVAFQADPEPVEVEPLTPAVSKLRCGCGSEPREVSTPVGVFQICPDCKVRVKVQL